MPDEQLSAVLDLSIDEALGNVESLASSIDTSLTESASAFGTAMEEAVAAVPEVVIEPDTAAVEPAITDAIAGADSTVTVEADGTETITGEIDGAISAADSTVLVDADTAAVDAALASIDTTDVTVTVDADTTAASASLDALTVEAGQLDTTLHVDAETADAQAAIDDLGSSVQQTSTELGSGAQANTDYGNAAQFAAAGAEIATGGTRSLQGAVGATSSSMGAAVGAGAAFAATLGVLFNAGVDATGAQQRFTQTLGDSAAAMQTIDVGSLNADLNELAISLGTDDEALMNAAASLFNFAKVSGATDDEADRFGETLIALAARAVAMNPALGSVADVAEGMGAKLAKGGKFAAGFGIDLNAAEIATRALADTGKASATELTLFEKSAAAAELAVEKYGDTIGGKVKEGTENAIIVQRRLKEEFNNVIEAVGVSLVIPMFDLIKAALPTVEAFATVAGEIAVAVLPALTLALEAVAGPLGFVGEVLSELPGPVVLAGAALLTLGLGFETVALKAMYAWDGIGKLFSASAGVGTKLAVAAGGAAIAGDGFQKVGESATDSVMGIGQMAAGGAILGAQIALIGGPISAGAGAAIGAVAGAAIGAAKLFLTGGESVEEYRKKFAQLGTDLEGLSASEALAKFTKELGETDLMLSGLGVTTQTAGASLRGFQTAGAAGAAGAAQFKASASAITDELRTLAEASPGAAQQVIAGLLASGKAAAFSAKEWDKIEAAVAKGTAAYGKHQQEGVKVKAVNDAVTNSALAQEQAIAAAAAAVDAYASKAAGGIPTVATAFDTAKAAAEHFGAAMSPEVLLAGLQESLSQTVNFTNNLNTIFAAGFTNLGALLGEKGAAAGGAMAAQLAEGIRTNQPGIAEELDKTAGQVTVSGQLAATNARTQGQAVVTAQQQEYARIAPIVAQMMGLSANAFVTATPAQVTAAREAAVGGVFGFSTGSAPIPGVSSAAMQNAAAAINAGAPGVGTAALGAGGKAATDFGTGVAPIPGAAGTAVEGAGPTMTSAGGALAGQGGAAYGAGFGVGTAFGQGIVSGMTSYTKPIIDEAARLVNAAEQAARDAADGHSPSRLFAVLGADLAAGVAVGLDKGTSDVASAAAGMIGGAHSAAGRAMTGLAGGRRAGVAPLGIQVVVNVNGVSDPVAAKRAGQNAGDGIVDALTRRGIVVATRTGG